MKFDPFDDDEYEGVGFGEISKISATQVSFHWKDMI